MPQPDTLPPGAVVVHTLPGRTRLRIADRRHHAGYFAALSVQLSAHPRVRQVTVNAQTASVLLRHDGAIADIAADLPEILRLVERPPERPLRASPPVSNEAIRAGALQALIVVCIALSVWQLRRGRLFGTASENLWNAFNAWRHLRSPAMSALLLGGGIVRLVRGPVLSAAASLLYYALTLRRIGSEGRGGGEKAG